MPGVMVPARICARAEIHDQGADDAHEAGGREAHDRGRGERFQHVFEQALRARGENFFLAVFRVVALDHANAAQRFGEPAGDFGIDFRTFAKNRADGLERLIQRDAENQKYAGGDAGHQHAGMQQVDQGKQRGHDAAGKFDQAGADQVADAFDVAHDPGNQHAGFIGVVVGDLQAADVGLHFFAHFGNHAPGGFGEQLGERKRSESLNDGGR